jgi:hypothetical protein
MLVCRQKKKGIRMLATFCLPAAKFAHRPFASAQASHCLYRLGDRSNICVVVGKTSQTWVSIWQNDGRLPRARTAIFTFPSSSTSKDVEVYSWRKTMWLIVLELTVIFHIRALRKFLPNPAAKQFCLKWNFFDVPFRRRKNSTTFRYRMQKHKVTRGFISSTSYDACV